MTPAAPPRHTWTIVAPAWAVAAGQSARVSVPVIHKYDTSDLVNAFLKDPTASLKFNGEDLVHNVKRSTQSNRINKFFNLDYDATTTRKLFLDTHQRFYLVVCEVHCDAFGFPAVRRDAICEAGFVVRRRNWKFTAPQFGDGKVEARFGELRNDGFGGLTELRAEATARGGSEVVQCWGPDPLVAGAYAWNDLTSATNLPNVPNETVYPLYPLIPDPAKTTHAAAGRTIYFGLIPTASTELDALGRSRFDDQDVYEIRTFVRQHHFPCPKKGTRHDCSGPLVWSRPTEPYQLAPTFDLIGTGYRTVNVKMPHLKTLKAQASKRNVGQRAPVRFNVPANSGPSIGAPGLPIGGSFTLEGGICFRNIPLTTIVAMVVYNIFKPIVMNIFRLYYLEPLEFCIPGATPPSDPASAGALPPSPPTMVAPLPFPPPAGVPSFLFQADPSGPRFDIAAEIEELKSGGGAITLDTVKAARDEEVA